MNRGQELWNPAVVESLLGPAHQAIHGMVVTRDGKEYRVIVSEILRGITDEDGNPKAGYRVSGDILYPEMPPFHTFDMLG